VYPGLDGGGEWGGAAADPDGILYVNSNEMAWRIMLQHADAKSNAEVTSGQALYASNCSTCHGAERRGNPKSGYPSLLDIGGRQTRDYVANIVANGKGMMPAFPKFSEKQRRAIAGFLFGDEKAEPGLAKEPDGSKQTKKDTTVRWKISGYSKFLDKNGYPAMSPPWGTLNAIDLNTGEYKWTVTYGEYPELQQQKGIEQTGSESYGGPVITASGLLLISGTKDQFFRAYDKENGKLLWKTQLPAANFATPSTYEVNGKQYVVLACGGTKLGAKGGDSYVAFALP
jgi:quinoprotein glucose dehydrogenase